MKTSTAKLRCELSWRGLFKMDALRRNWIFFHAEVNVGADAEFILQVVTSGKRVVALADHYSKASLLVNRSDLVTQLSCGLKQIVSETTRGPHRPASRHAGHQGAAFAKKATASWCEHAQHHPNGVDTRRRTEHNKCGMIINYGQCADLVSPRIAAALNRRER